MDKIQHPERLTEAQDILSSIRQKGYSLAQIAKMMQGRVSQRTLYRWINGKSIPQREIDLSALKQIKEMCCPS